MSERETGSDAPSGYALRGRQGQVIDDLGQQIVGGRYRPGELLPREPDLIARYEVSRTVIREAMKVLAAKGLVEVRPKVGTRVRSEELWSVFDSDILRWYEAQGRGEEIMRDLIEIRQLLEPSAARLAAGRAQMTDLRRIELAAHRMREQAHDHRGYAAADVEFHMAVYAASHNALLQRFGRLVADFMRLTFDVQQRVRADDLGGEVDFSDDAATHEAVYQAITRGDAEAAGEAMLIVVLEGKRALITAISDHRELGPAPS